MHLHRPTDLASEKRLPRLIVYNQPGETFFGGKVNAAGSDLDRRDPVAPRSPIIYQRRINWL